MGQSENTDFEPQIFAVRTALILLTSALEDRFAPGELRERLNLLIEEADMRDVEAKFKETSLLLATMVKNLPQPQQQSESIMREVVAREA